MQLRRIFSGSPGARRWLAVGGLTLLLFIASVSPFLSHASGQTPSPGTGATMLLPGPARASSAKTAQQWMVEGQKAQKAGDQMEAVYDFLNAQRLDPTSPEPLYAEGMSFFLIGWDKNETSYYDRAARHFKAALELDPKYDRAAFMMAMMEVVHNRLEEAEPYFQRAIGLRPGNAYYHLYYGTLLQRMEKYDAAVEQMRLAEKLGPTYVQAYLTLGQLYARKRQYQEARSQLERAVQLDSKRAEPYYTLGSVYHHLGMNAESQLSYRTFQRLKSVQPKPDPVAKAIQGRIAADSK